MLWMGCKCIVLILSIDFYFVFFFCLLISIKIKITQSQTTFDKYILRGISTIYILFGAICGNKVVGKMVSIFVFMLFSAISIEVMQWKFSNLYAKLWYTYSNSNNNKTRSYCTKLWRYFSYSINFCYKTLDCRIYFIFEILSKESDGEEKSHEMWMSEKMICEKAKV